MAAVIETGKSTSLSDSTYGTATGGARSLGSPGEKGHGMKDTGSNHRTRRRAGAVAAALAGAALLAAGCSSSPSSPSASDNGGKTRYQQAVDYAKCMRQHGEPAFPDPASNGSFPNNNNLDLTSAQYKNAASACKSLEPAPNSAQYQQGYQQLLKYSACMRSHGVTKYPDPVLSNTGVSIPLKTGTGPGEVNTNSTQFTNAEAACRSLQPGGVNGGGQG